MFIYILSRLPTRWLDRIRKAIDAATEKKYRDYWIKRDPSFASDFSDDDLPF